MVGRGARGAVVLLILTAGCRYQEKPCLDFLCGVVDLSISSQTGLLHPGPRSYPCSRSRRLAAGGRLRDTEENQQGDGDPWEKQAR